MRRELPAGISTSVLFSDVALYHIRMIILRRADYPKVC